MPEPEITKHYIARIAIQKVEKTLLRTRDPLALPETRRSTTDIANIVVSDETLAGISTKAGAHLALIDSDEGIS